MKSFLKSGVAAVALLLGVGAGQAADLKGSAKDSPLAGTSVSGGKPYNWTSVYVGGQIGYGNSNHNIDGSETISTCDKGKVASDGKCYDPKDIDFTAFPVLTPKTGAVPVDGATITTTQIGSAFIDGLNSSGVFGGGTIGADYQLGHESRFVIGGFFDYNISNASFNTGAKEGPDQVFAGSIEDGNSWVLAARAGLALGDEHRALVYALAGYGQQDVTYKGAIAGDTPFSKDKTIGGWVVGGGMEYALNNIVSIGAEYQHFFGSKENLFDSGFLGCEADRLKVNDSLDTDKVMAKLKIKLNGGTFGY